MSEPGSDAIHHGESRVQERRGEKVVNLSIPRAFQGHTFALDLRKNDDFHDPSGPWVVEFVLCSDYVIHEHDISLIIPEKGHSYLELGPDLRKERNVRIEYSYPDASAPRKEVTLSFTIAEDRIQRLILRVPESDLHAALHVAGRIVNSILDNVTLRIGVPTQIRHIEVRPESPGSSFLRRYMTVPYTPAQIEKKDLIAAIKMPKPLEPAVRLFREAISASRPHYRLLCPLCANNDGTPPLC